MREIDHHPLLTLPDGQLSPHANTWAAEIRELAEWVGDELTAWLLSDDALEELHRAIGRGKEHAPVLLHLKAEFAGTEDGGNEVDRLLSLPWELLRLGGNFPIEDGVLELVREAVAPGLEGMDAPRSPLTVVATVAAPADATALDYEGECYRLWQALKGDRLLLTDIGTVDELVETVRVHAPPVVHFTGHGFPGGLLFEDDAALGDPVAIDILVRRLREDNRLPRLVFLAACHGATSQGAPSAGTHLHRAARARSSAAALHRAGVPQVLAYFGPVGDEQSTRIEEVVYANLVEGKLTWEAVRRARATATQPHLDRSGDATHVYPLGWAQLALYHRGESHAVALAAETDGAALRHKEKERRMLRLDRARVPGGVQRLEFGFVGRRTARAEVIRRWRQGARSLVVAGLGGIGKTALCAEVAPALAAELRSKSEPARIVAFHAREARDSAQPPIRILWRQFEMMGKGADWQRTLGMLQQEGLTGAALARGVLGLAADAGALLVYVDDLESLQTGPGDVQPGAWKDPEVAAFWADLTGAGVTERSFGVLASSRYLPLDVSQTSALHLAPMREGDILRMLSWFPELGRLPFECAAWLAERLDGHPRTAEYLETLVVKRIESLSLPARRLTPRDWRREVLEPLMPSAREKVTADLLLPMLIAALAPFEREHLASCSLLSAPAPWELVLQLAPEPDKDSATTLARQGLLSPFETASLADPEWAPHILVVEAQPPLDDRRARSVHEAVGRWYAAEWQSRERWDQGHLALDHLIAAGLPNDGWSVAEPIVRVLRLMGRYREGFELVERVLAAGATGEVRGLGLAFSVQLGRLAGISLVDAVGRLEEAVKVLSGADELFALGELGETLYARNDLAGARRNQELVLDARQREHGEEHRDTLAARHALALTLSAQGDLVGARNHQEGVLDALHRVLGGEHPDTLAARGNLAEMLRAAGDMLGARGHQEAVLEGLRQLFGDEHPQTLGARGNLAGTLHLQGDLAGARDHYEAVFAGLRHVLGDEHPRTLEARLNLAATLRARGDLAAARKHEEAVLAVGRRVLDEEHPRLLIARNNLAQTLKAQGDLRGAQEHEEGVLEARRRIFGEDHPDTLTARLILAETFRALGDLAGARTHQEIAVEGWSRVLGAEHRQTVLARSMLARTMYEQSDLAGALEHQKAVYQALRGALGAEHPDTLTARLNLAATFRAQGDLKTARGHQEAVVDGRHRVLGAQHPRTVNARNDLAQTLKAQAEFASARPASSRSSRKRARRRRPKRSRK